MTMSGESMQHFTLKLSLCLCALLPTLANATLGEDVASVERDRQELQAHTVPGDSVVSKSSLFSVFVMQVERETIKEFVDHTGLVFAISWRGDVHPNLSSLLGRHYPYFAIQDSITPHGRRFPIKPIRTDSITVQRGGHLYDFRGLAILNGKLPPGVSEGDLQ